MAGVTILNDEETAGCNANCQATYPNANGHFNNRFCGSADDCWDDDVGRGPIRSETGWVFEGEEYGLIDHTNANDGATMNTGGNNWATHMWVYILDTTSTQTFFCRELLEDLGGADYSRGSH